MKKLAIWPVNKLVGSSRRRQNESREETYRDQRRCRDWKECNISDSLYKWYVNKQCDGFEKCWRNMALICQHHWLCVAIRLSRKRQSCTVSNLMVQCAAFLTRRLARWRHCSVQVHRRQSESTWVREEEKLEDEKIGLFIRDRIRVYQVWRRCGRVRVDSRRGNRDHGLKVYSSFDHLKMKRRKEKQTALSLDEDSYLNDPEWHLTDERTDEWLMIYVLESDTRRPHKLIKTGRVFVLAMNTRQ